MAPSEQGKVENEETIKKEIKIRKTWGIKNEKTLYGRKIRVRVNDKSSFNG